MSFLYADRPSSYNHLLNRLNAILFHVIVNLLYPHLSYCWLLHPLQTAFLYIKLCRSDMEIISWEIFSRVLVTAAVTSRYCCRYFSLLLPLLLVIASLYNRNIAIRTSVSLICQQFLHFQNLRSSRALFFQSPHYINLIGNISVTIRFNHNKSLYRWQQEFFFSASNCLDFLFHATFSLGAYRCFSFSFIEELY